MRSPSVAGQERDCAFRARTAAHPPQGARIPRRRPVARSSAVTTNDTRPVPVPTGASPRSPASRGLPPCTSRGPTDLTSARLRRHDDDLVPDDGEEMPSPRTDDFQATDLVSLHSTGRLRSTDTPAANGPRHVGHCVRGGAVRAALIAAGNDDPGVTSQCSPGPRSDWVGHQRTGSRLPIPVTPGAAGSPPQRFSRYET
jgi:hypothetical protein